MTLITDPDSLNQATEIILDKINLTIELLVAGNLSDDGVTGQALYSFLKEEWKSDSTLIPLPFPMVSITPEQFEFIEGWKPKSEPTRNLLRSCGWKEISNTNVDNREYMGIISLGNIDATDTAYYSFEGDTSKTDFSFAGTVNQGIQTFGDSTNGNFDKRALGLTVFIRVFEKSYGSATTASIGLTSLNYIANRFPLAEATDTKITTSDALVDSTAPYSGMSITYGATTRTINGVAYDFKVVIEGNGGTAEQINEFVQRKLRVDSDIDAGAGTEVGTLSAILTNFVGNDLKTTTGVFIDGFQSVDTNRISFTNNSGTVVQFPFVASGTLNFNANLVSDSSSIYRMFFTDTFGTGTATLVNDNSATPISATVGGVASIPFNFDYENNIQQGRTANTDALVTVVAIGLAGAQYVAAEATIGRSTGQNISLVAPLERNYST